MTESAKFNIGGHRYEVSRSILESHPDTMLAKIASDQWQKDPESEIFVDMDKIVRKVKVEDAILAKESILDRLEETVKSFSIQHIRLQESANQSAIKNRCAEIALFCCRGALRERKQRMLW